MNLHLNDVFFLLFLPSIAAFTLDRSSEAKAPDDGSFFGFYPPPPKDFLFIGVNSKFDNHISRNLHRQSWLKHRFVKSGAVRFRFLVAGSGELHPDDVKFGDCLRLPVPEDYHQLTAKTLAWMDWYKKHARTRYFMKLDDDSYPHLDGLMPYLQSNKQPLAYLGYQTTGKVKKTGKYAETKYWAEEYPAYMQGPAYILSTQLVNEITKPAYKNSVYANENTTVGIRVNESHMNVRYVRLPGTLWGCRKGDVISMNWDAREFPCVSRNEAIAVGRLQKFPEASRCCSHPFKHWHDSAEWAPKQDSDHAPEGAEPAEESEKDEPDEEESTSAETTGTEVATEETAKVHRDVAPVSTKPTEESKSDVPDGEESTSAETSGTEATS